MAGLPATAAQARVWLAEQLSPHRLEFVYPYRLHLTGPLDVPALERAVNAVLARHPALRTTFAETGGRLLRTVHPHAATTLSDVDAQVDRPFDLDREPPLRLRLRQEGPDRHTLDVVVHHIASDTWSMEIFFRELAAAYAGDPLPELPEPPAGTAPDETEALDHWRRHLAGAPLVAELPTDRPRPPRQSLLGETASHVVPAEVLSRLDECGRAVSASRFAVLLSLVYLTLHRWSELDDLVIGAPVAHRPTRADEAAIGNFVNLLPLRLRGDERLTLRQLLTGTRNVLLDGLDHRAARFEQVVEALAPERSLAYHPVVQVVLTDQNQAPVHLPGLITDLTLAHLGAVRYDLSFDYRSTSDGGLRLDLSYATDLFDAATAERLLATLAWAMTTAPEALDQPLRTLPLAAPPQLPAPIPHPPGVPWVGRLAELARQYPDRPAVEAAGGSQTFAELEAESARVAAGLRELGVGRGSVVGVCLLRELPLISVLIGVWRAGAAYLPLDPGYPAARLSYLAGDSGASLVLVGPGVEVGWDPALRVVPLAQLPEAEEVGGEPVEAGDLAYLIYTSGSTGRPKGVAVTHGNVAALLSGLDGAGVFRPSPSRVAWNASLSFDASVQQWTRVLRGDCVLVLGERERRDPELFAEALTRMRADEVDLTPAHLETLAQTLPTVASGRSPLRLLIGGEPIGPALWELLRRWAREGVAEPVNVYGPTECTVDSTMAWIAEHGSPVIGRPLPGVRAYVLDRWGRPVPEGQIGELHLGGGQVSWGYLGRPGMTAERFGPDPFAGDGYRMYRTGDRASWSGGVLRYHGRRDGQVKVRGFRVELAEVEAALSEVEGVRSAAAALLPDGQTLGAVFVGEADADTVRDGLRRLVPAHLVPSVLRPIAALPLATGGKLDRRAVVEELLGSTRQRPVAEPQGPIEELIAGIWRELLGVGPVSRDESFFAVGGHSILAVRLLSRLNRALSLSLRLDAVFGYQTIADQARHVEELIRAELVRRSGSQPGAIR